jgi:hypothetical protein
MDDITNSINKFKKFLKNLYINIYIDIHTQKFMNT